MAEEEGREERDRMRSEVRETAREDTLESGAGK